MTVSSAGKDYRYCAVVFPRGPTPVKPAEARFETRLIVYQRFADHRKPYRTWVCDMKVAMRRLSCFLDADIRA